MEIPLQEAYENNWEILRQLLGQYQTSTIIIPEGVYEYTPDGSGFLFRDRESRLNSNQEYNVTEVLDNGVLRCGEGQEHGYEYKYRASVEDGNNIHWMMSGKWFVVTGSYKELATAHSWYDHRYFRWQDVRVRLENTLPADPYRIQRALKKFFYDNLPQKHFDLGQGCNHEDACPITGMSLAFLRNKKRLVVIDGRCYAFYAFTHEREMRENPFTRQRWSPDAKAKIRFLRQHMPFLHNEYESMMDLHEQWETANGAQATARKSRTRGRTARTRRTRTARTIKDTLTGGKTLRQRCKKRGLG